MNFDFGKIELGTANFGLDYGITNIKGQLPEETIIDILDLASRIGIKKLDTANSYGDSQKILSKLHAKYNFKICTKISVAQDNLTGIRLHEFLDQEVEQSLKQLGVDSLSRVLIHNPRKILSNQVEDIIQWANKKKSSGLISQFGLSVYEEEELDKQFLGNIDTVQLPLSIYNQECIDSGFIKKLGEYKCSICARSLFLQGLILQRSHEWPNKISEQFRLHHAEYEAREWESYKDINEFFIAASFKIALETPGIKSVVIGITSIKELMQITNTLQNCYDKLPYDELRSMKWNKVSELDPRFW